MQPRQVDSDIRIVKQQLVDFDPVNAETFRMEDYRQPKPESFSLQQGSPIRHSEQPSSYNNSFSFPIQHNFPQTNVTATRKIAATGYEDIKTGLERIKHTQMEVLEQLRQDSLIATPAVPARTTPTQVEPRIATWDTYQQTSIMARNISALNSVQNAFASGGATISEDDASSSAYNSGHDDFDRYDSKVRETQLLQQKRKLENDLNVKMKKIEEMLLHQRQLQKTIHTMRLQMDRQQDEGYDQVIATLRRDQDATIERYQRQLSMGTADRDRLLAENTQLKKQLLARDSQPISETGSKATQEEIGRIIASVREAFANKQQQYDRALAIRGVKLAENQKLGLQRVNSLVESELRRLEKWSKDYPGKPEYSVGELVGLKQQILKLNQLKEKEVDQIRSSTSNYEYLQTEAQYQSLYFDLVTEIQNLKHKKILEASNLILRTDLGMPNPIESKYTHHSGELEWCRKRIGELEEQLDSLKEYVDNENHDKSKFLEELERSSLASKNILKENEQLKKIIEQFRSTPDPSHRVRELQVLILDQVKDITNLKSENSELKLRLEGLKSEVTGIKLEKEIVERQLAEKGKYCDELEQALAPIKPKHPFPLSKTWDDKEPEYTHKINTLQEKLTLLILEKEGILNQQTLKQQNWESDKLSLQQSIKGHLSTKEQLHTQIENLKRKLQQVSDKLVESEAIAESLRANIKQLENGKATQGTHFEQLVKEKATMQIQFQEQISRLIGRTNQGETHLKQAYETELQKTRTRLQAEKKEYFALVKQLTHDKQKLQEQLQALERQRASKQVQAEREIAKLTTENASLKQSLQQQTQRLNKSSSEQTKLLIERYQRDKQQLNKMNQQLSQENRNLLGLQNQNAQQALVIRQLQSEIKTKSSAVDHLWQVKNVEYENIMRQIAKMKGVTGALGPSLH